MLKIGVDLRGLQPQMVLAYVIACTIWQERAGVPCVITSASDSVHGPNSLHYKGMALDLRTNSLRSEQVGPIHTALVAALGPQFDVVLEPDHIHCEYDPKELPKSHA